MITVKANQTQTQKFDIPAFYFVAGEIVADIVDYELMEKTIGRENP